MADTTFPERRLVLRRDFDRSLVVEWLLSHRELIALGSIMLIAGLLRFWQLDVKALHHDESLHADFTWMLYKGRGYQHDPLMHGPFLFESGAIGFFLFGATDFTARLVQAIFGTLLVGMPYLLRRQMGMKAVFIAAVMITISPTLLYVSRFDRHDIFIVFWMMAMTVCVWRYLDERRNGWLYAFAAITALSFATMEVTFINVAILLVFLDVMLAIELGRARDDEHIDSGIAALRILAILPIAWLIAALWPFFSTKPFGRNRLPPVGDVLVVLGTLALPQYSAGIQALPMIGDKGYEVAAEDNLRNATMISLVAATAVIGFYWKSKVWPWCALAFYAPWLLLYTTFFTNLHGIFSGGWGSLDYWLDQQDVARGDQPWYYYSLMSPLYEYLPLVFAIGGGWWLAVKGGSLNRWFLTWLTGIFIGLSAAGEKMPWLEVHIALPLCLVGAVVLARAIDALEFTRRSWQQAAIVAVVTGAATLLLVEGGGVLPYLGLVLLLGALGWGFISLGGENGVQAALRVFLTVLVAALFTLTVRTSLIASFKHPDVPVEMLVYTQTSPEIPEIAHRIDAVAKASGLGYNLPITVDGADSFAWPWAWYLRDYHEVLYIDARVPGFTPRKGDIYLLNKQTLPMFDVASYSQTPYKHRWWFVESYKGMTLGRLKDILTSPSKLKDLGSFFLYRHAEEGNTGSVDGVALFPNSLAQYDTARPAEKPAARPQRFPDGRIGVGRSGTGPGELQQPADIFVSRDGSIWVADGKNNRIVKYDGAGNYLGALGPFSAAPAALNEPWGVAVDEQGIIYVADTWNHRIVKFSPSFQYITSWGEGATKPNPGPLELFGPRDITFAEDGSLLVTDTGNERIINYSKDGQPLNVYGAAGTAPGQFDEPVSLARDGAGRIYVADAWNGRIQRFQRGFVSPDVMPTGWTGHEVIAKPYIALLADGRIVAADPGNGSLILLDGNGNKVGTWKPVDGSVPLGVAATADGGFVYADASPSKEHLEIVPGAILANLFK